MRQQPTLLIPLALSVVLISSSPLTSQPPPDAEMAAAAVRDWFQGRRAEFAAAGDLAAFDEALAKMRVHAVRFCAPAHGRRPSDWVCLLEWISPFVPDAPPSETALPFRYIPGSTQPWTVLESDDLISPACAPLDVAERLLRAAGGQERLKVRGEIDDGAGQFTDSRVWSRGQKAPQRIMCRYEIAVPHGARLIEDQLEIAYLWYEDGHYLLERRPAP